MDKIIWWYLEIPSRGIFLWNLTPNSRFFTCITRTWGLLESTWWTNLIPLQAFWIVELFLSIIVFVKKFPFWYQSHQYITTSTWLIKISICHHKSAVKPWSSVYYAVNNPCIWTDSIVLDIYFYFNGFRVDTLNNLVWKVWL